MSKVKKLSMRIATFTGVASTVVPLVSSLTSCSEKITKIPDYDKEYGITKKSYCDMKDYFVVLYKNEMERQGYKDEALKEKMKDFNTTLISFDNSVDSQSKTNKYATATFALSHFAKTVYGFDLQRDQFIAKKITWSNINQMFQGVKSSWDIYLKNNHMPDEQRNVIIQHAQDEYNKLSDSLKAQYPNDTLTAYTVAQSSLVKCFEDVNEQIGLLAAQARLSDFMSTYIISYKDQDRETNGFDVIKAELNASIGKTLSNDLMNKVFQFYNNTNGEIVTFKNDIIPSHIINPVLTSIKEDKYSNRYSLDIDWQIHKYKENQSEEEAKRMTAHIYLSPNKNKFDSEGTLISQDKTVNDLMTDAVVAPTLYGIQSTTKYAQQSVLDTYFNPESQDGYISSIHWSQDTSKPNPWEVLFKTSPKKGIYTITTEQLGDSGIELEVTQPDGGGIVKYSLKGLLQNLDPKTPDKDLSLAQKFVKYCDLQGQITIVSDETNKHIASATFDAAYKDEYWQPLGPEYVIQNETNFAISDKLYADVNMKFNNAYEALDIYRNTGIKALKKSTINSMITMSAAVLLDFIMTAAFTACVVKPDPVLDCNPAQKARDAAVVIMQSTNLLITCAQMAAVAFISAPVFEFDDNMNLMKNALSKDHSVIFNDLCQKFDNDHKKYFVLWETDKNPDKDFKEKKAVFTNLPWLPSEKEKTSASTLNDFYGNFLNSKSYQYICEKAQEYNATPEEFIKLKSRQDKYVNTLTISGFCFGMAANAIIDRVIQRIGDRKVMALVREKQMTKFEENQKKLNDLKNKMFETQKTRDRLTESYHATYDLWRMGGRYIEEFEQWDEIKKLKFDWLDTYLAKVLTACEKQIEELLPWIPIP